MPVAINGIRVHDNINGLWYSVYPEKAQAQAATGSGALTVVFGGSFNDGAAGKIRGVLTKNGTEKLIDYIADVAAGETHVFELTFDVAPSNDNFIVQLIDVTPNKPPSYPSYLLQTQYGFTVLNPEAPSEPSPLPSPQPQPTPPPTPDFQPLPLVPPAISDVINWIGKASFPDIKLFDLKAPDFGNILGVVAKALGDTMVKPLENLPALLDTLNSLPNGLNSVLGGIANNLVTELFTVGSDIMSNRILDTLKGTPLAVKNAGLLATATFGTVLEKYVRISNPEGYLSVVQQGADVMPAIRQQVTDAYNLMGEMDRYNFALGLASLGQIRTVSDEITMLEGLFGVSNIVHQFNETRMDKAVYRQTEYYFNEVYQPEIPTAQDLINMVVKEKIPIDEFKTQMLKRGFNRNWSQLLWDSHFNAPDLNDILTAWRRGIIDEKRVDELMILIDLDPAFKQVFDTRKYVDPSLMNIRLMYETGAITAEDVPNYIHRLGYSPEFEDAMIEFVIHFQERRYRTRYITQLMTALAQGKSSVEEVKAEVAAVGFSELTADLIVKTALLRQKTLASAGGGVKEAALTLSELKRAYSEDIITEDFLRNEMLLRNYALADIQIVLDIINKDKAVQTAGRRQVALTVSEMLSAWRYGVIDEENLRTNLLARGLDLNEVNVLIETKRRSWGIGNIEQASG